MTDLNRYNGNDADVAAAMLRASRIIRAPVVPPWLVTVAAGLGWCIIAAAWFVF